MIARTTGRTLAGLAAATLAALVAGGAGAGELVLSGLDVTEFKAAFGRVESRDLLPARARIGGTLAELHVTEGSPVAAGEVVALVVDDKLALQLRAVDARIRAVDSELANARTELERASALAARGIGTQQRVDQLRTQVEVLSNQGDAARSERAVVVQQAEEGRVLAPTAGRVLRVPVTRGAVVLPGETVAVVAGGGFFLRLALPERHAGALAIGARVAVEDPAGLRAGLATNGRLIKLYPQIENGRVIADVELERLDEAFVGERLLVRVPIGTRRVIAVPADAIASRGGVDFVRVATPAGPRDVAVVTGGAVDSGTERRIEILSGLSAGDRIVLP